MPDFRNKQMQEEIHHFSGWEGGEKGHKSVNKHFVNKLALLARYRGSFYCLQLELFFAYA